MAHASTSLTRNTLQQCVFPHSSSHDLSSNYIFTSDRNWASHIAGIFYITAMKVSAFRPVSTSFSMTTYSGFVATAQRTTVNTWIWLSNGSLSRRPKKGITIYNPISQDGLSILATQMVFVPGPPTVGNGPFYMTLADLYARTGNNAANANDARTPLQSASTLWKSSFDAWLLDGSPYTVSADAQPDPTPDTTKTYTTDSDLAFMWSLITTRIKDASDQP